MRRIVLIAAGIVFSAAVFSQTPLEVVPYITDSMVIQHGKIFPVSGTAPAGTEVKVIFGGNTVRAVTNDSGRWTALLPPMEPSRENRTMVISTPQRVLNLNGILVGDVWLAGGQSNMAMLTGKLAKTDLDKIYAAAKDSPEVRLYYRGRLVASGKKLDEKDRPWESAHGKNVRNWSAVATVFALELNRETGVPIGIVSCSNGGTTIEAWISPAAYRNDDELLSSVAGYYEGASGLQRNPSSLFNYMLDLFRDLPLKGVIWYQGESNGMQPDKYGILLSGLIKDWRTHFGDPRLPFIIAQLPLYKESRDKSNTNWAKIRWAQYEASVKDPDVTTVVLKDLGWAHDIHPLDKIPVGERLARAALGAVYNHDIPYKIDVPAEAAVTRSHYRVAFGMDGFLVSEGEVFLEVLMPDGQWKKIVPDIGEKWLSVDNSGLAGARAIRYAWDNDGPLSLYSDKGVPVPPFCVEIN